MAKTKEMTFAELQRLAAERGWTLERARAHGAEQKRSYVLRKGPISIEYERGPTLLCKVSLDKWSIRLYPRVNGTRLHAYSQVSREDLVRAMMDSFTVEEIVAVIREQSEVQVVRCKEDLAEALANLHEFQGWALAKKFWLEHL